MFAPDWLYSTNRLYGPSYLINLFVTITFFWILLEEDGPVREETKFLVLPHNLDSSRRYSNFNCSDLLNYARSFTVTD